MRSDALPPRWPIEKTLVESAVRVKYAARDFVNVRAPFGIRPPSSSFEIWRPESQPLIEYKLSGRACRRSPGESPKVP